MQHSFLHALSMNFYSTPALLNPLKEARRLLPLPDEAPRAVEKAGKLMSLKLCWAMAVTSAALSPRREPNAPNL